MRNRIVVEIFKAKRSAGSGARIARKSGCIYVQWDIGVMKQIQNKICVAENKMYKIDTLTSWEMKRGKYVGKRGEIVLAPCVNMI